MSAFNILLSGGTYYVSTPNYRGGTVYPEADVKELVAALEIAREFLDPESPPPRMGNTSALELINTALAKVKS